MGKRNLEKVFGNIKGMAVKKHVFFCVVFSQISFVSSINIRLIF